MSSMRKHTKLTTFLAQFKLKKGSPKDQKTHVSFGQPFGAYGIPEDQRKKFMKLYSAAVEEGGPLHLLEMPIDGVSPLQIDVDLKFSEEHKKRQYSADDVSLIVRLYTRYLKKYFNIPKKKSLRAFVMEKRRPNFDEKKQEYRDGWHISYPEIPMTQEQKAFLLYKVKEEVVQKQYFDHMKFTNHLDDVFDFSIYRGTGWCMYGSRKHTGSTYSVTKVYSHNLKELDLDVSDSELVKMLSMHRYTGLPAIKFNPKGDIDAFRDEFNYVLTALDFRKPPKPDVKVPKKERIQRPAEKPRENRFENEETVAARRLLGMLSDERCDSYQKWVRVGWALCNIDQWNLFDDWIEFSKRSAKFDYDSVGRVWDDAKIYSGAGYHLPSLKKWAREDSPAEYSKYLDQIVDPLIEEAMSSTHYDIAEVMKALYGDIYRCVDLKGGGRWYNFKNHRWRIDRSQSLSLKVSRDLVERFVKLQTSYLQKSLTDATDAIMRDQYRAKAEKINKIIKQLKTSGFVKEVMNFCSRVMFDDDLEEKLDSNPYLLGFENGVYDLRDNEFREGGPDDYVSLSTGIEFHPYTLESPEIKVIDKFFSEVMTEDEMRNYVYTFLASTLDGTIVQQQFIIWTGGGGNGKSTVIEFFMDTFGDYCGVIPITLLTQKRGGAGAATPELNHMRGKRFAAFQEPEQNSSINVGYMKELTGGDKIFIRPLYSEGFYIKPQFSLILTCNSLPMIPSTDDGTWRRLRVTPWESRFIDPDETIEDEKEFHKDYELKDKLERCREAFAWYLLEVWYRLYRKEKLHEPPKVKSHTDKYRKKSDKYANFMAENLKVTKRNSDSEDLSLVFSEFCEWYYNAFATKQNCPRRQDFEEYLLKNGFTIKNGQLFGVRFRSSEDIEDLAL